MRSAPLCLVIFLGGGLSAHADNLKDLVDLAAKLKSAPVASASSAPAADSVKSSLDNAVSRWGPLPTPSSCRYLTREDDKNIENGGNIYRHETGTQLCWRDQHMVCGEDGFWHAYGPCNPADVMAWDSEGTPPPYIASTNGLLGEHSDQPRPVNTELNKSDPQATNQTRQPVLDDESGNRIDPIASSFPPGGLVGQGGVKNSGDNAQKCAALRSVIDQLNSSIQGTYQYAKQTGGGLTPTMQTAINTANEGKQRATADMQSLGCN